MKKCTKCGALTDNFSPMPKARDGLHSWCRPCINEATKKYNRARPAGERHAEHVRRTYGLAPGQYDEMLAAQGGVCAICKQPQTLVVKGKLARLAVDHCHRTGVVRRLLCDKCNRGLGYFYDNPALLRAAADYLEGIDP